MPLIQSIPKSLNITQVFFIASLLLLFEKNSWPFSNFWSQKSCEVKKTHSIFKN